ncbi:c-type cytochrome [Magnetospirillum molischianum]|nr:cytochrome c [Magnetospirillum molischianum]
MLRLLCLVFAVFLGLGLAAQAAEPTLTVSDGTTERLYSRSELLTDPRIREVTIAPDPIYSRSMTYRAIPAARLLEDLRPGADDHIQVRATDGFSVSIPVRLLTQGGSGGAEAFLAIELPEAPWPVLPAKNQTAGAGPFYLVWLHAPRGTISSEYWSYRVAALTVVDSPTKRWPGLAVAAKVPENDPIRHGLERFVAVCMACHRFNGEGESDLGPDLGRPMNPVHYFQPAALRQFLRDPGTIRTWSERKMPAFAKADLSDSDIEAIIAWLSYKAGRR